jgi:diguanylate cyclase (GGDEF)-like protein
MSEQEIGKSIVDQIPSQVLDLMLDVVLEVMRAERGSIMLLDEKCQELTIRSARGLKKNIIEKARVKLGSGVSGKVAASGQSVFLKGVSGERRLNIKPEDLVNPKIDTSYIVPITLYDGTVGTININSTHSNHEIRAEKEGLVKGIVHRFFEYLAQVQLPLSYHETPSQLYMMNIFREYTTLRELRVVFDYIFHMVTDLMKVQKKGVFLLKDQESGFFDLVLGYGFDTRYYREIYEELIPCLKKQKIESVRKIIIFNRKELFSESVSYFQEDFYILMPLIWRDNIEGHLFLFAGEMPHELAFTDSLTGTYNYGLWWKRLHEEFSRMQRLKDTKISLIVFDIDHLDRFNRAHGYLVGDQLLRAIADRIKSCSRINDIVGRIGGDEFGVVLPDTSKEDTLRVADRVLDAVSGLPAEMHIQLSHPTTLSCGIAGFPDDADTPGKLVERAKTALVSAKIMGGNRIKSFENLEE